MLPQAARFKASPADGAKQIESYRTRLMEFDQTLNRELFCLRQEIAQFGIKETIVWEGLQY
jgi:hypothetical protein